MGVLHGHELFLEDNDDLVKCLICIYLLKSALTELATESQLKRDIVPAMGHNLKKI